MHTSTEREACSPNDESIPLPAQTKEAITSEQSLAEAAFAFQRGNDQAVGAVSHAVVPKTSSASHTVSTHSNGATQGAQIHVPSDPIERQKLVSKLTEQRDFNHSVAEKLRTAAGRESLFREWLAEPDAGFRALQGTLGGLIGACGGLVSRAIGGGIASAAGGDPIAAGWLTAGAFLAGASWYIHSGMKNMWGPWSKSNREATRVLKSLRKKARAARLGEQEVHELIGKVSREYENRGDELTTQIVQVKNANTNWRAHTTTDIFDSVLEEVRAEPIPKVVVPSQAAPLQPSTQQPVPNVPAPDGKSVPVKQEQSLYAVLYNSGEGAKLAWQMVGYLKKAIDKGVEPDLVSQSRKDLLPLNEEIARIKKEKDEQLKREKFDELLTSLKEFAFVLEDLAVGG